MGGIGAMKNANDPTVMLSPEYRKFIEELKARAVAADLRQAFPEIRGFSPANVWRMRQLSVLYSSEAVLAQVARELGNHSHRRGEPSFAGQAVSKNKTVQTASQADEMLKSSYNLEFLGIRRKVKERELEDRLISRLQAFILELGDGDQPSIGIILCAEKDDVEVEYVLRTKANPIGVAAYQLQSKLPADLKGKLPTAKQLADVVRAVLPERRPS